MHLTPLKLRSDLVTSCQDGPDGSVFVLKDPVSERFFRLKEAEYFIAQQFDGRTPPTELRGKVENELGVKISAENLEQFASRLQRVGLLTATETSPAAAPRPRRRMAGDIFYLRYRLFDPDRFFDWLLPQLRFFFTGKFVAVSALLVVCAFGLTTIHWAEMMQQFRGLFSFESLLFAWVVLIGVVLLHECAHGLTCKNFGGRVREIGFMLIYFQPAFYCNVSDAWLFPEKSKRLWVTFAGAYFETVLWAGATLVWCVTDPHTLLNRLALIVVATSAIKSFFNLNPLIKLDGYYLLSDYLGIPNLRQKAFSYVGTRIKRLWGVVQPEFQAIPPRDRWIFLLYAVLAGGYTYWLLTKILLWFGSYLVWRYQAFGFILFSVALGILFRRPIMKVLSSLTSRPHAIPAQEDVKPEVRPPRRRFPKKTAWLLFLAAVVAALFYFKMELRVAGMFTVLPLHNTDVRAQVEGIVEQVLVREGDYIEKGGPIARLSDRDYTADLRKTRAEIEANEAQLKLLKAGPREEEIALAKTLVAKAAERIKFAESRVGMDKDLFGERLISRREYEETQESVSLRQQELQEARDRLTLLLAGNRPEQIEATEADLRRLRAHEQYLQQQLASLVVNSPVAGIVTTDKPEERVGEHVKRGDLIVEVHELKTLSIEIAVPEREIADVRLGQKVVFKARAYPEREFHCSVMAIAPIASSTNDPVTGRTVVVRTQVPNETGLLKPSMTGAAKILCGEHRVIDLITRRFLRYLRVEFWSWW